ncbi:hypothetical protein [Pseudomonas sp. AB12(2023)]|uniref:hypothetical protein n=1 Tax=Pseudomonas sp. AB12(2023) TaxID=3048597 RepID=UPI002B229C45|nr:hypothetical protein [Pseudomonas sp. AB12(2023)]MEB0222105.1 hypothetical protein [Pseudomonas sp. AB12(2023)]
MNVPVILLPANLAGTKERLQKRINALRVTHPKLASQERHQITGILIALVELGLVDLTEAQRLEAQADENHKFAVR